MGAIDMPGAGSFFFFEESEGCAVPEKTHTLELCYRGVLKRDIKHPTTNQPTMYNDRMCLSTHRLFGPVYSGRNLDPSLKRTKSAKRAKKILIVTRRPLGNYVSAAPKSASARLSPKENDVGLFLDGSKIGLKFKQCASNAHRAKRFPFFILLLNKL